MPPTHGPHLPARFHDLQQSCPRSPSLQASTGIFWKPNLQPSISSSRPSVDSVLSETSNSLAPSVSTQIPQLIISSQAASIPLDLTPPPPLPHRLSLTPCAVGRAFQLSPIGSHDSGSPSPESSGFPLLGKVLDHQGSPRSAQPFQLTYEESAAKNPQSNATSSTDHFGNDDTTRHSSLVSRNHIVRPSEMPGPRCVGRSGKPGEEMRHVSSDGSTRRTAIDEEPINPLWGIIKAGKARKRLAQACL